MIKERPTSKEKKTVTLFKHAHTKIFLFISYTNTHTPFIENRDRKVNEEQGFVPRLTLAELVNLPFNLFA